MNIVIFTLIILILLVLLQLNISPLEYNPFKNKVHVPNALVESFIGHGLELDSNTNKENPLIKLK